MSGTSKRFGAMLKMKIGIIGADGQLGFDLARIFAADAEVVGWTLADFDVTDKEKISAKIKEAKPDVIINTAAFHKVEECELDPGKSFAVNAAGAFNAAKAAAEISAKIVFISTDYVFGNAKNSYSESDAPDPLNVYGASKLAGEIMTRIANPNHYIVRTSALFGEHQSGKGHNFVQLMLGLARDGKEIKVVDDQFTAPTFTPDLSQKIKELIFKNAPFGAYHITNQSGISWYEFAKIIFETAGISADLKPIKTNERPSNLVRPKSTILINNAIQKIGLSPMRPLKEALAEYIGR